MQNDLATLANGWGATQNMLGVTSKDSSGRLDFFRHFGSHPIGPQVN
jgi:hypothetical protein